MLDKYEEQLKSLKDTLGSLGTDILESLDRCEQGVNEADSKKFNEAREVLKNVENSANKIDQKIVTIFALYGPEAMELRTLVAYLKITTELVRISDNIKSFSKRMKSHISNEVDFSSIHEYSSHLAKSSFQAIRYAIESISETSEEHVAHLFRLSSVEESKTDDLYSILQKNIMTDLCKNIETSAEFIEILSTMRKLERMADRSVNITKLMLFARSGGSIKQFG